MEELQSLVEMHRDLIELVILGAAQTEEQVEEATEISKKTLGDIKVLKLPGSLIKKGGKEGGMPKWFLDQVE